MNRANQNPDPFQTPPGRLYHYLSKAKANDNVRLVRDAWANQFGVSSDSDPKIHYHLAVLRDLLDETERVIYRISGFSNTLMVTTVREFLSPPSLDASWSDTVDDLSGHALEDLKECAIVVSRHQPEFTMDDATRSDIRESIDLAYETVRESSLDTMLQNGLLALLSSCRRLLDEYDIRGASAIREMLVKVTGELALQFGDLKQDDDSDCGSSLYELWRKLDQAYKYLVPYRALLDAAPAVGGFLENLIKQ